MPAIGESAVAGFDLGSWVVLFAPARTPPEILRRLAAETTKALAVAEVQARLRQVGALPAGGTPEDASRFHLSEFSKWGAIVRAVGVRAD